MSILKITRLGHPVLQKKSIIVKNHINFSCLNPLIGNSLDLIGPRFPSLLNIYNEKGNNYFIEIAKKNNINIRKGVLGFFLGPARMPFFSILDPPSPPPAPGRRGCRLR